MYISKPHDSFFKAIFSNKKSIIELLRMSLPPKVFNKIDLDSIEIEKGSFISKEFKQYASDLIVRCKYNKKDAYIYILFEHKSHPDKFSMFQVLMYMASNWYNQIKAKKKLTIIIPVIFYHGKEKWKTLSIREYYRSVDKELERFAPDFDYLFDDLSVMEDEELINKLADRFVSAALLTMKYTAYEKEVLKENLKLIFSQIANLYKTPEGIEFVKTLLMYIFGSSNITPEEVEKSIETIDEDLKEVTMTTAQVLIKKGREIGKEEGIQQGLQQGIQQGMQKGEYRKAVETAKRMYKKGFDIELISEVTELSIDELKKVLK